MDMAPGLIHWDNLRPVQIGRVLLGTELSIQLVLDFFGVIQVINAVALMIQDTFIVDRIQVHQDSQVL